MGSILSHNRTTIETRLWKGIVLLLFGLPLLFAVPTTLHATSPIPTTIDPPCNLKGGTPSVTICTPGAASVVSLPVHIVAGLKDSHAVTSITLSIDGSKVTQIAAEPLDFYVKSLSAGAHTAVVKVVDSAGVSFSKSVKFTVTANAGLSKIR